MRLSVLRRVSMGTALIVLTIFLSGCGQHVDKIGDLNSDPGHYLHRDVIVAGEVTQV